MLSEDSSIAPDSTKLQRMMLEVGGLFGSVEGWAVIIPINPTSMFKFEFKTQYYVFISLKTQ